MLVQYNPFISDESWYIGLLPQLNFFSALPRSDTCVLRSLIGCSGFVGNVWKTFGEPSLAAPAPGAGRFWHW